MKRRNRELHVCHTTRVLVGKAWLDNRECVSQDASQGLVMLRDGERSAGCLICKPYRFAMRFSGDGHCDMLCRIVDSHRGVESGILDLTAALPSLYIEMAAFVRARLLLACHTQAYSL